MKFTKEQYVEAINAKLKEKGFEPLSEQSIAQVETMLSMAGEEEELDSFVSKSSQFIVSYAGQWNKKMSDAIKDIRKDDTGKRDDDKKDDIAAIIAEQLKPMSEAITTLQEELNRNKAEKTAEQLKSSFIAEAKKAGYSDAVISVTSRNFDFSAKDAKDKFDACLKDNAKDLGFTPNASNEETEKKGVDVSELKKELDAKYKQSKK